jgi:glycine hydroxymethyltransferase
MLQNEAKKPPLDGAVKAPERTVLYHQHVRLTDKSHVVPFAGYLMPSWYSSIAEEHAAVREAAGLFDCTHMGVLGISGEGATEFVNELTTNDIVTLEAGHARYSFVLDASGAILDDVIVYRKGPEELMLVVNAVNNAKIKNWIDDLLHDQVCIDPDDTNRRISGRPIVQDLRIVDDERDCKVDVALQGPRSLDILSILVKDKKTQSQMAELRPFQFMEVEIDGPPSVDCLLSHTGYTGAKIGFELFVHPEEASSLWEMILRAGSSLGVLPCGLGARDSLRIEAGYPLYGHELAGEFDISPFEAGYGWAVKLDKEFFIGKAAMEHKSKKRDMKVVRIELPGRKGTRPVRQNDGVLDEDGRSLGWVLSCAMIGEKQIALAYVDNESVGEGDSVGIYYVARSQRQVQQGRKEWIEKGDLLEVDLTGKVVSRFAKF